MSTPDATLDPVRVHPRSSAVPSLDLPALNAMFESSAPEKIVEWAAAQFGDGLVMSSSFGAESATLLHMASAVLPRIRVIFVDTGYLFPETWSHLESLRRRLDLNVWVYRTKHDPIAFLREHGEGEPTWRNDVENCCRHNKNEPFERAMKDLAPAAWLRGVRRSQADTRRAMEPIQLSPRYGCYAVSPLLNLSTRDIHAYMKRHDLPYHPLYEKGYPSIGCNPTSCTRPVQLGEDPRSGRWSGQNKVECGINLTNSLDSAGL
jgi:phosphoadenosine phosphosulfate reductase